MKRRIVAAALVLGAAALMLSVAHPAWGMYHPQTGRWLQRDPAEHARDMSLSGYVSHRPTSAVDPQGLAEVSDQFEDPYGPDPLNNQPFLRQKASAAMDKLLTPTEYVYDDVFAFDKIRQKLAPLAVRYRARKNAPGDDAAMTEGDFITIDPSEPSFVWIHELVHVYLQTYYPTMWYHGMTSRKEEGIAYAVHRTVYHANLWFSTVETKIRHSPSCKEVKTAWRKAWRGMATDPFDEYIKWHEFHFLPYPGWHETRGPLDWADVFRAERYFGHNRDCEALEARYNKMLRDRGLFGCCVSCREVGNDS